MPSATCPLDGVLAATTHSFVASFSHPSTLENHGAFQRIESGAVPGAYTWVHAAASRLPASTQGVGLGFEGSMCLAIPRAGSCLVNLPATPTCHQRHYAPPAAQCGWGRCHVGQHLFDCSPQARGLPGLKKEEGDGAEEAMGRRHSSSPLSSPVPFLPFFSKPGCPFSWPLKMFPCCNLHTPVDAYRNQKGTQYQSGACACELMDQA